MSKVGIIKEVDKVGRIVIPKELRERYGITERTEIIATEEGLLVRSPKYCLVYLEQIEKIIKQ